MSSKTVWNFWAKYYKRLWVQKISLKPTRLAVIKIIKQCFKYIENDNNTLLDVGCGVGELLNDIQLEHEQKLELMGFDYSEAMIEIAKENSTDVTYKVLDVYEIDKEYIDIDIITCTHSFPYYNNQRYILEKFYNVLKVDGDVILAFASQNTLYDKFAMWFVKWTTGTAKYTSIIEMKSMCDNIFETVDVVSIKTRWYMPSIAVFHLKKKR